MLSGSDITTSAACHAPDRIAGSCPSANATRAAETNRAAPSCTPSQPPGVLPSRRRRVTPSFRFVVPPARPRGTPETDAPSRGATAGRRRGPAPRRRPRRVAPLRGAFLRRRRPEAIDVHAEGDGRQSRPQSRLAAEPVAQVIGVRPGHGLHHVSDGARRTDECIERLIRSDDEVAQRVHGRGGRRVCA